jgi:hypothetical protein
MAELTMRSPGVSAREIDLTSPTNIQPSGIPAGIIGTATRGPAFVPVTFATYRDFAAKFGDTDGEKFGPLAVSEWLRNAQSVTYMRVLGIGDGEKRTTTGNNAGKVTRAGFIVGDEQPQDSGLVARNPFAVIAGVPGRMHFLGCFMSESAGSTIFSDAGIQPNAKAAPIIRAVIMAASGVVPMISSSLVASTQPSNTVAATTAGPVGFNTGSVNISSGKQEFTLLLNGHKNTSQYPNVLTASFDPTAPNYFLNVLNSNPYLLEDAGLCVYTHYDIHSALAVVTGTGVIAGTAPVVPASYEPLAFILTSSMTRNSGSAAVPNFESFEDRFRTAVSPYVVSQKYGGTPKNLFRIHALDDGTYINKKIKISIRNISKSSSDLVPFGTFDVLVRDFTDNDENPVILEQFLSVNLNPSSERYIAKIIGDQHVYFDFDKNSDGQKLVLDGNYPNVSKLIRVEVDSSVEDNEVPEDVLPAGHRGIYHLVTSGSAILSNGSMAVGNMLVAGQGSALLRAVEPAVPFRKNVTYGVEPRLTVSKNLYWGTMFERQESLTEPNKTLVQDTTIESFTQYFPKFHTSFQNPWVGDNEGTSDSNGIIYDADRFNNNAFSLENLSVRTGSNGIADPKEWASASYVRYGGVSANDTNKTRAFNFNTDLADLTAKSFAKFTFFLQGGFDGVRIFDEKSTKLLNESIIDEINDSGRGGSDGPTVKVYEKALTIIGEKSSVDIKLLAIPGIRHSYITDQAISKVEERFDALFIMDIDGRDSLNFIVTSSIQDSNVSNTAVAFASRGLDTSFAAAYYPDQIMIDPTTQTNIQVPPSVVVLGAFSLNDSLAHPWFAPAGFARGALTTVVETSVNLTRNNLDTLYDADINPITAFPGTGPIVWGQKTLLATQSALDRVNVRRLMIELRREVREIANRLIFEPNRESTLAKFEGLVRPRLQRIQTLQGITRFKVKIDTSTTTQADVENNTIRGVIYVQPTKSTEFISLDFVVSNAGASI